METPWCHASACVLQNEQGKYFVKSTPASLVVNKSEEDLVMTCEKEDASSVTVFESSANGYMTAGNILLFGRLLGVIVDDSSGAGYDYQTRLISDLNCGDEPEPEVLAHLRRVEEEQERLDAATKPTGVP